MRNVGSCHTNYDLTRSHVAAINIPWGCYSSSTKASWVDFVKTDRLQIEQSLPSTQRHAQHTGDTMHL